MCRSRPDQAGKTGQLAASASRERVDNPARCHGIRWLDRITSRSVWGQRGNPPGGRTLRFPYQKELNVSVVTARVQRMNGWLFTPRSTDLLVIGR